MKKWLMPVLALSFMAACGAQQEETADQSAHGVVVVRLPENAAEGNMSQAEVRAFSADANAFANGEDVASAFGAGEAVTFNTLTSDEDASESSTESGRYNNYNRYSNNYGNNHGRGFGNSYGNSYSNNNYWNYNRNRDCFSTGSNYYYRNKRHNHGGFNYFMYFR